MAEKWIAGAIKHPGALRDRAKRLGLLQASEPLSQGDLAKLSASGGETVKRQVRLARTLRKLGK